MGLFSEAAELLMDLTLQFQSEGVAEYRFSELDSIDGMDHLYRVVIIDISKEAVKLTREDKTGCRYRNYSKGIKITAIKVSI